MYRQGLSKCPIQLDNEEPCPLGRCKRGGWGVRSGSSGRWHLKRVAVGTKLNMKVHSCNNWMRAQVNGIKTKRPVTGLNATWRAEPRIVCVHMLSRSAHHHCWSRCMCLPFPFRPFSIGRSVLFVSFS